LAEEAPGRGPGPGPVQPVGPDLFFWHTGEERAGHRAVSEFRCVWLLVWFFLVSGFCSASCCMTKKPGLNLYLHYE
jgi:hypothetical protein